MNFTFLADIFFPHACAACGCTIMRGALCETCRTGITIHKTLFCGACGKEIFSRSPLCHPAGPYILGAAARYNLPALQALVHTLKFRFSKDCAVPLAEILIKYIEGLRMDLSSYIVVPIPLSRARFRTRGFNQSELIARIFADRFGIRLETRILFRIRHGKPQSETKNRAERLRNIAGAFAADKDALAAGAKKNIILIDDVTTSGATFREAAQTLRSAGAEKIFALAAAKA